MSENARPEGAASMGNASGARAPVLEVLEQYLVELEHGRAPEPEVFIAAHPALADVPFILETPGSRDPGGDVDVLKALREQTARG